MPGHGNRLSSVAPNISSIPCKNKRKKTTDTSIIRRQPIKEPVNPRKRAKENTLTDEEKGSPKEKNPSFCHKVYYKGDTNEKTRGSDDSPGETDGCVRNLDREHKNK